MDFAIVRFTDEDDAPGIVSRRWIDSRNNTCWYPNVKTEEKKNKLLLSHASPSKEWVKCPMRILKRFSSYHSARSHLREAEDTSNLESDAECIRPRKRKMKSFNFPHSSSEEEESQSLIKSARKEAYPSPPFTSSLTFSTPPPKAASTTRSDLPSTSQLSDDLDSVSCLSKTHQVLDKKIDNVLSKQQNVWHVIEDLLESTRRIESKLDTLLSIQNQQVPPSSHLENEEEANLFSSLPLGIDDFVRLDKKIAENSDCKKRLSNLLMIIGGRDIKSLACNFMRKLLLDEAGEKFSLTGKSSASTQAKMSFEKTETYKLLIEICFRNFKDLKLNVVREAISDWLMQSKFRKSKREKRLIERSVV